MSTAYLTAEQVKAETGFEVKTLANWRSTVKRNWSIE